MSPLAHVLAAAPDSRSPHTTVRQLALPATLRLALQKPVPTRIIPTGSATLRIPEKQRTAVAASELNSG